MKKLSIARLSKFLRWCILLASFTSQASLAADPIKQIDDFLQLSTFKAGFVQKVYSEDGDLIETSEGYTLVHRPGRFVWQYTSPDTYIIVSDGLKFTAYDPALSQAHVSHTLETLSTAPLMVLLSRNDVFQSFYVDVLKPKGVKGLKDGLSWLRLDPKVKDSEFQYFDVGFGKRRIKKIVLYDHFKQRIEVTFSGIQVNVPIAKKQFTLDLPEGTDIIDYHKKR